MTKKKRKADANAMSAWLNGVPMKRLGITEASLRAEFRRVSGGLAGLYTDLGALIAEIDSAAQSTKGYADDYRTGVRHGSLDIGQRIAQCLGHASNRALLSTVTGGDGGE